MVWPTIPDEPHPDPNVTGQMDVLACGPACVEMTLGPRGIRVTQLDAAIHARGLPGTQVEWITEDALLRTLQKFDPRGGWVFEIIERKLDRGLVQDLCRRGPWIAWVPSDQGHHSIVIAGVDLAKDVVLVKDPWVARYPRAALSFAKPATYGSTYAVSLKVFLARWPGYAFYPRAS